MEDFSRFKNLRLTVPEDIFPKMDYEFINKQIEESQKESLKAIHEAVEERERKEQEKRENLKRIADNSEDTVNALKETNLLLKKYNESLQRENENLSHRLNDIQLILLNLFSVEVDNGKEQNELMKQAIELANEIEISIATSDKFDWKGKLADTTATALFMALQVLLHSKGLM